MNGKLKNILSNTKSYAVDTNIFIYFLENHTLLGNVARQIIEHALSGKAILITAIVTPIELLSLKSLDHNSALKNNYMQLLRHPQIMTKEITLADAEGVARYRRTYGQKTADAIQMYTAAKLKAEIYFTNDSKSIANSIIFFMFFKYF